MEECDDRRQPLQSPAKDAEAVGLGRCCLCGRASSTPTADSDSSEQQQQQPLLLLDCFHGVCPECAAGAAAAAIVCPECDCKTFRSDLGEPLTSALAASLCSAPPPPPVPPPLCDNCSQDASDDTRREAGHRCADCKQLFCRSCLRVHNKFAPGHAAEPLAAAAPAPRLPLCSEHTSASRSHYCADCGRLRCEACSLACAERGHGLASAAEAVAAAFGGSAVGGPVALARDAIRDALGKLSSQRSRATEAEAVAPDGDPTAQSFASERRDVATEPALRLLQLNGRRAAAALQQARTNAERRLAEERDRRAVERDRRAAEVVRVDAQLDRLASYAERLLQPPPEHHAVAAAVAAAALDQRRQLVDRMRELLVEREALASSAEALVADDDNDAGQLRQQVVRETTAEEAEAAAAVLLGLASLPQGSVSSHRIEVKGSESWLADGHEEDDDEGNDNEDEECREEDYEGCREEDDGNSCRSDGGRSNSSNVPLTATPSSDRLKSLSSTDSSILPAGGSRPDDGGGGREDVDERTLLSCCACGEVPVKPVVLSCLHCCCTDCLNVLAAAFDPGSGDLPAGEASSSVAVKGKRAEQRQQRVKCSLCNSITPAASVKFSSFADKRLRQLAGASTAAAAAAAAAAYCNMCLESRQENVAASHICPDCGGKLLCTACLHWHNKFSRSHAPRSIGDPSSASSTTALQQSQRPCERHGVGCRYDTYCFLCATVRCTDDARTCASVGHDAVAISNPRAVEQARGSVASLHAELESAVARIDAAEASAANLDGALSCALNLELKLLDDAANAVRQAVDVARGNALTELRAIYGSLRTCGLPKVRAAQGSSSRRLSQAAAFCRLLLSSGGEEDLLDHHNDVSACLRALGAEADGLASACSRFKSSSPPQHVVIERWDVDQGLVARWIGLPRGDAAKMLDWKDVAREQQQQQQQQQRQEQMQQQQRQQQNQLAPPSGVAPLRQQSLVTPTVADDRAPVRDFRDESRSAAPTATAERVHSAGVGDKETRTVQSSIRGVAADNAIQTPRTASGCCVDEAPSGGGGGRNSPAVLRELQFEAAPSFVVEVTDDARSLLLLCRSECEDGRRGVRSIVVAGPRRGLEEFDVDSGAMLSSWLPTPETGPETVERPTVMSVAVASVAAGEAGGAASGFGGDGSGASGDLLYVGLADSSPAVILLRRLEMDDGVVWMDEQHIVLRAVPWQLAADGDFLVVAGAQQGDEAQPLPYSPGPFLDLYRRSGPNEMEELFSLETAYDIRCVALVGKIVVTLSNNRMPSASGRDEQAYVLEAFSSRGDMLWRTNGFDATDMCALPLAGLLCFVSRDDQRVIALGADDGRYVADILGGDGGAFQGASRVCFSPSATPFAMATLSSESWVSVYTATVERRGGVVGPANRLSGRGYVTLE